MGSKSALVLNLSKYWLTSYFTLIIILIYVIPNSVYLYFAFVLTLFVIFVMYYFYLRTIENLDHSAALKKVLCLFCSFVIITIITLIIMFTTRTEDPAATTGSTNNICAFLNGIIALFHSWNTINLIYKVIKYGNQGYHLWSCCIDAFRCWLFTFWVPSWKIPEISILCTLLLLVSCYLYLQQMSHRIMTGLNEQDYITTHCAKNSKQWLFNEIKQLFVPYTYCNQNKSKNLYFFFMYYFLI